jgi:hypothetical protein
MENTKLTLEELDQIKELQTQNQALAMEFGNLETTKIQIEKHRSELVSYYDLLKQRETELGKTLSDKYGIGTVDLDKGEFIPNS